jgi:hypothetical protein
MNKSKLIIVLLLVGVIGGGAIAWYMYEKPVKGLENVQPDVSIDGAALFTEFETDEIAANEKYLGKIVEVTGIVRDKEVAETGNTIILGTANEMFGINCGLHQSQQAAFDKLKAGDLVTLKGECAGYLMDVVFVRCVIVE